MPAAPADSGGCGCFSVDAPQVNVMLACCLVLLLRPGLLNRRNRNTRLFQPVLSAWPRALLGLFLVEECLVDHLKVVFAPGGRKACGGWSGSALVDTRTPL
jgi:hypothetical protein